MVAARPLFLLETFILLFSGNLAWHRSTRLDSRTSEDLQGQREYIFFESQLTWNEAREVCMEYGGDLAKFDSQRQLDEALHFTAEGDAWEHYPNKDYWIGVIEPEQGARIWVSDCSLLSWQSQYGDSSSWSDKKLCFRILRSTHMGVHEKCKTKLSFVCEVYNETNCAMSIQADTSYSRFIADTNATNCSLFCATTDTCWGSINTPHGCYLLGTHSYNSSEDRVLIKTKNCIKVSVVTEDKHPRIDDSLIPKVNCSGITVPGAVPITTLLDSSTELFDVFTMTEWMVNTCDCSATTTAVQSYSVTTVISTSVLTSCPSIIETSTANPALIKPQNAGTTPEVSFSTSATFQDPKDLAESLSNELRIDAKQTTAYTRKLISVPDERITSKFMGYVGVIMIVTITVSIVMMDCLTLVTKRRSK